MKLDCFFTCIKNNYRISSKTQAVLIFSKGKLYVKDMSEHQSAFIRCEGEVELEDGDIMLIGNQRFKFNK